MFLFYRLCRFLDLGFPFLDLFSGSAEASRCGGTAGADSPSANADTDAEAEADGKRSISSVLMTVTRLTSSCVGCRSTEVVVGVAAEVTDTTVVVVADVAGKTGMKEAILRSFFDDDDASAS